MHFLQVGHVHAQRSWVTALEWTSLSPSTDTPLACPAPHVSPDSHLLLVTACCDGSVSLLSIAVSALSHHDAATNAQLAVQYCGVLRPPDLLGVHCLSLSWLQQAGE